MHNENIFCPKNLLNTNIANFSEDRKGGFKFLTQQINPNLLYGKV